MFYTLNPGEPPLVLLGPESGGKGWQMDRTEVDQITQRAVLEHIWENAITVDAIIRRMWISTAVLKWLYFKTLVSEILKGLWETSTIRIQRNNMGIDTYQIVK